MRSKTPATSRSQVVAAVAEKTGTSAAVVGIVVATFLDMASSELAEGKMVRLTGFGTFRPVDLEAREYYDISTGQKAELPERRTVRFRPGQDLRNKMAGGDA